MIKNRRSGLILFATLLVASGSIAAGWSLLASRLPDPRTADREGLMRWMIARDLSAESPQLRAGLLERLEQEMRGGIDLADVDGQIDAPRREVFWGNVDVLLEDWFVRESQRYAEESADSRLAFLGDRIDDVLSWQCVQQLRRDYARSEDSGANNNATGGMELIARCQQRIDPWIAKADARQAQQMNDFVADVKTTLMMRYLTGTLPPVDQEPPSP